jgi:hypothetical protein
VKLEKGKVDAVHDVGQGQQGFRSRHDAGQKPDCRDDKVQRGDGKRRNPARSGRPEPSSKGARIKFSGGKPAVIDGPFPETKDLIADYWLIQVNAKQKAIDWAKRCPSPQGEGAEGEIELRQLFELEDFGPSPAIEDARRLESELAKKK